MGPARLLISHVIFSSHKYFLGNSRFEVEDILNDGISGHTIDISLIDPEFSIYTVRFVSDAPYRYAEANFLRIPASLWDN